MRHEIVGSSGLMSGAPSYLVTRRRLGAFGWPQYRQVTIPSSPSLGRTIDGAGLTLCPADKKLLFKFIREDQMPLPFKEALEWLDRAEQAREIAWQLTEPGARRAVLELADSFDRLARGGAIPDVVRRRELARPDRERNS